jgi:cytidylate kinase
MIIAIDGPAGSGKSSTARAVAQRLGFRHLDSGAFYRALTWAALERGTDPATWDTLTAADLEALEIHARPGDGGFRMHAGNRDISVGIRSPEVNANVSAMARLPVVRGWLLGRLREAAGSSDLVADGRDIGTVVFPDAEVKVFLTADPRERARRRLAETGTPDPTEERLDQEVARLVARDKIDSEREHAPLKPAPDAVHIDTTRLTFDEQVNRIAELARAALTRSR